MILLCILTLIVLFILFFLKIRRNNRDRRAFEAARADLYDGFYHVLTADTMSNYEDVEKACNATLDNIKKKYRPETLSRLISEICMDLSCQTYLTPKHSVRSPMLRLIMSAILPQDISYCKLCKTW